MQDWEKVSSTKKTNRFHPPEVLAGMEALSLATEHLQAAAKAAWHAFLTDFAALYLPFRSAVQALAALDALHSLAVVAQGSGYVTLHILCDRPAIFLLLNFFQNSSGITADTCISL